MEISPAVPNSHNQEFGSSASSSAEARIEASSVSTVWKENESRNVPVEEEVREEEDRTNRHATAMSQHEDDEDEEDVCRICRNSGEYDNPLRYPCACSGSMKFVHQDCLLQWLKHSSARQCEVCKHAFSFSPVYAENAPAWLPFEELVFGIGVKAYQVLKFFVRLSFVLFVWLLIVPLITSWIWQLAFVRSLVEANRLFLSRMSTNAILTDSAQGFFLSGSILFIFLGATSVRDYCRHLRELEGQDQDEAARRAPNRDMGVDGEARGIARAGQLIRRNAEQVAARRERRAARLEVRFEQMFGGLDGAEDVPFDELVGMRGPLLHLVQNAFTVLASNTIFLGLFIFVPFSLGRMIIHYLSWLFNSATGPVLSSFMPLTDSALEITVARQTVELMKLNASVLNGSSDDLSPSLSSTMGTSRVSDATILVVGYMLILSLFFLYLNFVALIRYTRGEPLTMRRFHWLASLAELAPSTLRHFMILFKTFALLGIEVGLLPFMCGWWLDVCTIGMFGKSMAQRVEFLSIYPLVSFLIHYVVGMISMLLISIFVILLRGVLSNGVLYFVRDPADPNYNPFRDLIDDPLHKHARRLLLSVAAYGSLIVMLVFFPVKLSMRVAHSVFPLDTTVSDLVIEIPACMLLLQICVPFAIEHFKLRTRIESLLRHWLTAVGWALGLTEFLLPRTEDYNGDERRYNFILRIALLLIVAWMTLLVFNSALIVVPVSVGRAIINSVLTGLKCKDFYTFTIGIFVIWTVVAGVRYVLEHIQSRRGVDVLIQQIPKWSAIFLKTFVLLSIWVPVNESPVFVLYHDWALGLVFLRIWTRLVVLEQVGIVDESWRRKFERVREGGFSRLEGVWIMREMLLPIVMKLLTALCVPYVLAKGVFPALGYPLIVNSAVYRYAWLGFLSLISLSFCVRSSPLWLTKLHNSVRDDRYLIGRHLHNFREHTQNHRAP